MKERLINVLKWFFIALGILFFALIILIVCLIIIANTYKIGTVADIKPAKPNLKEIQSVINFVEEYKKENGIYPDKAENIKQEKNTQLNYSTYNDSNCYKIEFKNSKTKTTKQYQHCIIEKDGSISNSENYSEVKQ